MTIDELDLEAEQIAVGAAQHAEPAGSRTEPLDDRLRHDARSDHAGDRAAARPAGQRAAARSSSDVDRNSPAASGGVIPGDVILEVNRQKVANVSQVNRELQKVQNGQVAFLLIWRDGNNQFVTMTKR